MLSWLAEKLAQGASDIVDVVDVLVEDVMDIPSAIEKGWTEGGLMKDDEDQIIELKPQDDPEPFTITEVKDKP